MGRLGLGLALAVILILIVVRTYPRVSATGTRCRGEAGPARQSDRPRGEAADLRARGKAARGKAAYNLVKYYLAFAFKLFYYVLFDL